MFFTASASDFTNLPTRLTKSFDFPFSAIWFTTALPTTQPSAADATAQSTGTTALILGVVVDNNMRIIRFLPNSVLFNYGPTLGDIITLVDDKEVKAPAELTSATSSLTKGTKVKIGYLSHGLWKTWIYIQL